MIITQKVEIKLNAFLVSFFKKKNIENISINDTIMVDVTDLPLTSKVLITSKCECGTIKEISYKNYIKNTKNNKVVFSCSKKCSVKKTKKTCIEKYGVDNPSKLEIVKSKKEETCMKNHGVKNPTQSYIIKSKIDYSFNNEEEIKKKKEESYVKNYGVVNPSKSLLIKNKKEETCMKNFNVSHHMKSNLIKEKTKNTFYIKYNIKSPFQLSNSENNKFKTNKDKFLSILTNENYTIIEYQYNKVSLLHNTCGTIFQIKRNNLYDRLKINTCLCTICYPINESKSIKEKELINWLKEIILCSDEHKIEFIEGDRNVLDGKELDIYIPSKKLAIEFNGLYWHSEHFKEKNYHLDKSLKCQEKGIRLLHIWEDEWVYKQEIVKSIILNKLGLIKEKVYARQCDIRFIDDSKLVRHFLDNNHIQGYSQSSIKLGLYYQNELISLMTFGYRHTNSKKEFELIRFCNKINLNVIGAASKLFNYFKKNYQFTDLISYSDFRLFDGKMYETLGFSKQYLSLPDYFWCKDLERRHRFNFNKQKLIREGFDSNKTEVEIMHERGYYRIFGCGQYRWKSY
jgi:hypothetical protein